MNNIDIDDALDRFDGDRELWAEFAETWLETAQADHDAFLEALAKKDGRGALYYVHKLKGAAASIGASRLAELGQEMEIEVRELKLEAVAALLPSFEDVHEASIREARSLISRFRTPS